MFDHFLVSVVLLPPLLAVAARLLADHLAPRVAASVMAWSAAAAALASVINLAAFALKAAAETSTVARLFGWSARVVADDTAHVPWVSWTSVALLAAVTVSVTAVHARHRRLLTLAGAGTHPAGTLLMIDDDEPQAYAVPGRPGHIVVSTGMRDALTGEQFEALLAHERAHLAARHHRLIRLCELAAAAHPALWWVTRHVDYLVERAADEHAAADVGCRTTVARAISAAALASSATPAAARGLNAVSPGGVVPRRVVSLLRPRRWTAPPAVAILPAGIAAFSLVWTGECVYDLGELIHAATQRR